MTACLRIRIALQSPRSPAPPHPFRRSPAARIPETPPHPHASRSPRKMYSRIHGNVRLVVYTYTQMAKDQVINVRVSVEEKAALKKAAGAGGIGPYLRALGLAQANGIGPRTSGGGAGQLGPPARELQPGDERGTRDPETRQVAKPSPLPAPNWPARVRQLTASGVPRPAAERIADLEFRG